MADLIERWATGDEAAGEALYRDYFTRVRDFMTIRGLKALDAEEVAHEALAAGLEGLRDGARPEEWTAWIMGIAKHVQAKRRPLVLPLLSAEDSRSPSARSQVIRKEMSALLGAELKELSATDRRMLDLAHRAGLSRKEIAEKLEVDVEAIHSRFDRVIGKLKGALSKHFTELSMRGPEARGVSMADIHALRPLFRQPMILRHLEGKSEEEAARHLAIPLATLRARLQSGYELLGRGGAPDFSRAREEHRQA